MTKKEAVEILRHADTDSEVDADDYLKAFDMAVSALESESNREDFLKELDKLKERYEKNFRNIHKAEVVSVMRYMEIFHHDLLKREEHPIYPGHNEDDKVVEIGRNPALDVKPSKLPTGYSPRYTIRELLKSSDGSSPKEKNK